jgi:formate hydrogenlyase subunit 6/NADH:ubiquinone oxidoreductase subunit I
MSDDRKPRHGYFGEIWAAGKSVLEGMAVTLAELGKAPVTVEYPDRTDRPVVDTLPERYRGFLEVDLDTCTACKACERACPIDVIVIDLEKRADGLRGMTRFDIDLGKCMYCNLCVEACPVDTQSPGDTEASRCIRMTREFEGATTDFNTLTFRFIRPGDFVTPFKPRKGVVEPSPRRGDIAREVRRKAQEWNPGACASALAQIARSGSVGEVTREATVRERAAALAPRVAAVSADPAGLAELLVAEALGRTDCEACGHATCRAYADAMVEGRDVETWKCEPGAAKATRDTNLILALRVGKTPEEAAEIAVRVTREKHKP